jgi:hypothetical protein
VVNCKSETACKNDAACVTGKFYRLPNGEHSGWCHLYDSVCDEADVNLVYFLNYFEACNGADLGTISAIDKGFYESVWFGLVCQLSGK